MAQALEALLGGASTGPSPALAADSSALAADLAALAQRVELLEQAKASKPAPITTAPQQQALALDAAEAITTAALAERTGTSRGAWNNWARPERIGQVRHHPQAGPWRLVGKAAPPAGGPERWIWEPAG